MEQTACPEGKSYMEIRLQKLQDFMKEENLAGILFLRPQKEGYDLWLTGLTGKESMTGPLDRALLAVAGGAKILSFSTPSLIEAGAEDPWLPHALPGEPQTPWYMNCTGYYGDYFRAMLETNHRLGLVNGNKLLKKVHDFILRYAPETEFIDVTREVHLIKAVKSAGDIALIRKDLREAEHAFAAMGTVLRPGVTERDAVYAIRKKLLERGANGWDYSVQCLDVQLTSAPDGAESVSDDIMYPGRTLGMGDRVNVKINASMAGGYQVCIGRCYSIGDASEETARCWDLAVSAQQAAADAMKPGVSIRQVMDTVNAQVLRPAGFPADEGNWIYGIGQAWSEYPMAVPGWWDVPLAEGMVLAVGPRVKPEGKDPYCCQDIYVITKDGAQRLGRSSQARGSFFCTAF